MWNTKKNILQHVNLHLNHGLSYSQRGSHRRTVLFSSVFFSLLYHDNSWTAARSLMKFCGNMYLDNRSKPREFQCHRSKVNVTGPDFRILYHCEILQKACYSTITHEPLDLGWWNVAILTNSRTVLNFKVISQKSKSHGFLVFFCVRETAATRGQYLASSRAWWCCFVSIFVPFYTQ